MGITAKPDESSPEKVVWIEQSHALTTAKTILRLNRGEAFELYEQLKKWLGV